MIEIHAHVLPAIDDGPRDIDQAVALLRAMIADGVTHVVATPHVYPTVFDNNRSINQAALDRFRGVLEQENLQIGLSVAGEVRFNEHVVDLFHANELPFLGQFQGRRTLLLEMPDNQIPLGTEKLISWLLQRDIQPVIAHPERNRAIREQPELGIELVEQGCLLQVTAGALLGGFGDRVQEAAEFLVRRDAVIAIASDAHNLTTRMPCMAAAGQWLAENINTEKAHALTVAGPAAVCGFTVP